MATSVKGIKNPILEQTFKYMNRVFGKGSSMIDTYIQGIPCAVELMFHKSHSGAREGGQLLEPDEPAHFDIINIFKRGGGNGNHMAWLEAKMTDEDRERIFREAGEI